MHDESQIRAPSLVQVVDGFFRQRVQAPSRGILLDLPVPRLFVEFDEPIAKGRKLAGGELESRVSISFAVFIRVIYRRREATQLVLNRCRLTTFSHPI